MDNSRPTKTISVILPVANNELTIAATINSILSQSHRQIELIIINDGSSDKSAQLIDECASKDSRISVIHCPNCSGGPAQPRNLGLAQASGELLAFIDADDLWHPQKLSAQVNELEKLGLDFISSDCLKFSDKEYPALDITLAKEARLTYLNHEMMLRKNRVITSSILLRTAIFNNIGFDEHSNYYRIEDYAAWLHLLQNPEVKGAILHLPLVFYRLTPNSLSSSKIKMAKKIYTLLNNYQVNGCRLGLKRFYYFFCYAVIAIKNRIISP